MARRSRGLGLTYRSRVHRGNPRALCRLAREASPEMLPLVCRKLLEALSEFGRESPEARIRARACGCPVC